MNNKTISLSGVALFCLIHIGNAVYADEGPDYPPSSCEEGKRVAFTYSHYEPWPKGQKSRSSLNFSTQLPLDNEVKEFKWLLPEGITVTLAEDQPGSDKEIFSGVKNGKTTDPTQVYKLYVSKPQNAANRFRIDVCGLTEIQGPCYSTDWFSEEYPGRADCDAGYAVRGMRCDGRYCDNKQLNCCSDKLPTLDPSNREDSPWFSDPGIYMDATRVLTGLACQGRYCDDLQMRMYGFKDGLPLKSSWTQDWFSEEQGGDDCTDGGTKYGYVVGIECKGDYCDNLRFTCADYNVN